jgi:hypothetical protein
MAREVVHESNHKICKLVSLAGFMLKFERMYLMHTGPGKQPTMEALTAY